jgi:hypothetical protein
MILARVPDAFRLLMPLMIMRRTFDVFLIAHERSPARPSHECHHRFVPSRHRAYDRNAMAPSTTMSNVYAHVDTREAREQVETVQPSASTLR